MSSLREVQRWPLDAILAHQHECATILWGMTVGERGWVSLRPPSHHCCPVGQAPRLGRTVGLERGADERRTRHRTGHAQCMAGRQQSLPSPLCPGPGRLTLLVAVDADDLTEGHHQGIVPVNAEKKPDWCHCVPRPAMLSFSSRGPNPCETTLKTG